MLIMSAFSTPLIAGPIVFLILENLSYSIHYTPGSFGTCTSVCLYNCISCVPTPLPMAKAAARRPHPAVSPST